MTAQIQIADGTQYYWESDSILPSPSNQPSPSAGPPPQIYEGLTGVSVYVRVDNTGDEVLGAPGCPTGPWGAAVPLTDYDTGGVGTHAVGADYRLELDVGADQLVRISDNAPVPLGKCQSNKRAWGLSPDGKFFAFVTGPTTDPNEWRAYVVVLPGARNNVGNVILPSFVWRQVYPSASSQIQYTDGWTNESFGWVGSRGLFTVGTVAGLSQRTLLRFKSGALADATSVPTNQAYTYLASPCGSTVAYVPPASASTATRWVSTNNATDWTASRGNVTVPQGIKFTGGIPTINTNAHTLNGVSITNANSSAPIDDPDESLYEAGLWVQVGRIAAGTVTSGSSYYPIGLAAGPRIAPNGFAWVEVPQTHDWLRHGVDHWCFVAQAWEPNLNINQPWPETGAFPWNEPNCAQRNFSICLNQSCS